MIKKSLIYHNLVFPEDSQSEIANELKNELVDLINVKAAPSYALLLYLFSREDLNVDFYREIIKFLVKYFIRRNITDFPNTRNLDQIFMDLIEEIESAGGVPTVDLIIKYLSDSDRMSGVDTFIERLSSDIYELNVDATRFILSKIEESKSTREIYLDFWARDKSNKLIWTIEHIFPEGKNIPAPWVEMIAGGDKEIAEQIQEDYVHKLGNLTLTGFNQKLSNFDFERKRDRKNQEGNYIGYKNGLFLNEDLKDKNNWTKEDIIKRTKKIVDLAVEIFKVE
ncbi:HNH endonuclease family protein [Candidatus Parcubacteria bacterium]|nr:HNH endonuclease family protein [Candidatus Parcubacteria bacterium]